jgi:protocatechuate 3,4-dioxygenase beta subunit
MTERDAMRPTGSELLGPFYKKNAPNIRVLRRPGDLGVPLQVSGTVHSTRGQILPNASIDVWHADVNGRYDLDGYRYRAKIRPSDDARYSIETIIPGHYDDRPAQHIHYLVSAPGHKALVTQAYFATDPFFRGDPDANYARDGIVQHRELVRPVTLFEEDRRARATITFDIVLEQA